MSVHRWIPFFAAGLLVLGCGPDREQALREKELELKTKELALQKKALELQEQALKQAEQGQQQMQGLLENSLNRAGNGTVMSAAPASSPALPNMTKEQVQKALELQEKMLKQLEAVQQQSGGAADPYGQASTPYSAPGAPSSSGVQSPEMQKMFEDLRRRGGQ